ncbi:MAG: translation elongation factor Ts [Succinivibrio dextrinosolvens]|uniref:translation elongation factor Ts n=1 Tax=Succinivibrio sp. TaxID=2053619 RepID=UPI0025F1518D|nr:translation elongation factor Ts [Succinivibrio sp.]MDY6415581.1 translation elongation factor Ts [Succinivibrio dextrinosolvens]MBQ9219377.1 elongation factor Ts [Succinivibrio sp.]MDY6420194.1 translation elongation factor Ts [Succinivibrio dextrinosolvens]MDY6466823.1 translation elongation factor Ts [Succinivibrio dextrinosolvens]MDY6469450.1 translation elongation factor Ts [Succinivibrio dextrinosolvens]
MATVTAAMVKELRDATGAGMMDCKKALVAADGNMQAAIDAMRKSGAAKAAKKAGRTAAEGVITVAQNGNKIALVEVNSETDFCAKNAEFVEFAQKVADVALANSISDIEALKNAQLDGQTVAECLTALVAKIGENLQVRRVSLVNANADETVGVYVHSNKRIGVAVVLKGGDTETAKHVAMHVCAAKPQFVKPEDVSADVVEHERQVQIEIAMNSGKPQNIAEKMVEGRMKKFTGEVSLTGQQFVMNPEVTVGQMLKEKGADAVSFVRLEVGEGIEKQVVDFAAEVQAQVAAAQK